MNLQFIVRNWRLKLVALAVACGMWVGVVYAANPPAIRTIYVPVQVNGLSSALLVLHAVPKVAVKVDGVASNVGASIVSPHLSASVNLAGITRPGVYHPAVKFNNTDPDVAVLSDPSTIQVVVDNWKTAELPVHVKPTGLPPSNYSVSSTSVSPSKVLVRAPASVLPNVVVDADVHLSNQRAPVTVPVTVTLVGPDGTSVNATANPSLVTVRVDITSATVPESATVEVELTGQVPSGYELVSAQPTPLTLTISGPESVLPQPSAVQTRPINISNLTTNATVTAQLVVPAGVTASVSSVTVEIVVRQLPTTAPTPTPTPTPIPTPTPKPTPTP
jgi:YbbR domain-containing protein